jgi:hypothetical protein
MALIMPLPRGSGVNSLSIWDLDELLFGSALALVLVTVL